MFIPCLQLNWKDTCHLDCVSHSGLPALSLCRGGKAHLFWIVPKEDRADLPWGAPTLSSSIQRPLIQQGLGGKRKDTDPLKWLTLSPISLFGERSTGHFSFGLDFERRDFFQFHIPVLNDGKATVCLAPTPLHSGTASCMASVECPSPGMQSYHEEEWTPRP